MAEVEEKTSVQQTSTFSRWPSLPTTIIGMLNPFGSNGDSSQPNADARLPQTAKRASIFANFLPSNSDATVTGPAGEPPSPSKDDASIMFAEPDTRSTSDAASCQGSVSGDPVRLSPKKSRKNRTSYSICHAPPASKQRQRMHRRPRSLLQLHRICPNARPQPAYEVILSANFSVRLTKAVARVFRAKHSLCSNDLLVLQAEKYSTAELDEDQEERNIIALICKGRKEDSHTVGKAKICLPNGEEWEAFRTPTGGYEFSSTDEHGLGLKVRWVPKKNKDGSKDVGRKSFNFSTISPNSRRHPVIAALSKSGLDLNDTYKIPDVAATTPLTTPRHSTVLPEPMQLEQEPDQEEYVTDDKLRELILTTGIWVTLKEGWSPTFKYDDKDKDNTCVLRSPSAASSPAKSGSFPLTSVSTPLVSPGAASLGPQKRNSVKDVGSNLPHRNSILSRPNVKQDSTSSLPNHQTSPSVFSEGVGKTNRGRADSTSTVLIHRAASNRASKNHRTATWRPEMVSRQQELRETPSLETPRLQDIAQPIHPPPTPSSVGHRHDATVTSSEPSSSRRVSPEKTTRRSSATTSTTNVSGASEPMKKNTGKKKKRGKGGGWRRLLCGGGQDV